MCEIIYMGSLHSVFRFSIIFCKDRFMHYLFDLVIKRSFLHLYYANEFRARSNTKFVYEKFSSVFLIAVCFAVSEKQVFWRKICW